MDDEEDPNPALGNQLLLQVNVGGHSWLLLVLWSKQIQGKPYNSSSTASHGQDAALLLQRTDSRQNFLSSPRKPKRAQTACCKHTNTCADTVSAAKHKPESAAGAVTKTQQENETRLCPTTAGADLCAWRLWKSGIRHPFPSHKLLSAVRVLIRLAVTDGT